MSVQSVRVSSVTLAGERRRKSDENVRSYSGFVVKFILIVLAFTGAFVGHLYLRQQSVKSAERTDNIKKQIMQVKAENGNLKIEVARLTRWDHVIRKIAEFRLPLGPAASGQVMAIKIYSPEQAANIPLTPLKVASNTMPSSPTGRR